MDLVDAVNFAKKEGSNNPYWSWDQSRRDEFKSYRAALRAQEEEEQKHAYEERDDDDDGDDGNNNLDDILASSSPAEEEEEEDDDDDDKEEKDPVPKKAPLKWVEYCGYAREALKEGGNKPTQKEVFAKAREWLIEDNWMKPK